MYRIGPGIMRLAVLRETTVPLRSIAKEHVRALAEEIGETTHVSQVSGDELSTLTYAYSTKHGTRVTMEDAERLPFHATSSGLSVWLIQTQRWLTQFCPNHWINGHLKPSWIRSRLEMN